MSPKRKRHDTDSTTPDLDLTDGVERANLALVQRFRLFVVAGPEARKTYTSTGERAAIGSYQAADLVLKDRTVSRFHCDITMSNGEVVIRDLGSRNGTLVDGVSVLQARLRSGQMLTLGRSQLRFDLGDDAVEVPLSDKEAFGLMVGRSRVMRAAFAVMERAARTDSTVLLEGDTGTGKEAAAQSLHLASERRDGPFVVVDCGAIPPDLLESELFGHEKGSFTGAISQRRGAFEGADGGTIFLDEIGELGKDLQPKLLRALERREIKRVGGTQYQPVDVRVVAATNRDLRTEVTAGRFRSDLYYRLAVVQVRLPSLRERPEDLPLLVENILVGLEATEAQASPLRTQEFLADLGRHPWPGNVRELRNFVERSLTLHGFTFAARGDDSTPEVVAGIDLDTPLKVCRERVLRNFEKQYLEAMLRRHGGNLSAASRAAGVDRITFYRMLSRNALR